MDAAVHLSQREPQKAALALAQQKQTPVRFFYVRKTKVSSCVCVFVLGNKFVKGLQAYFVWHNKGGISIKDRRQAAFASGIV